MDLKTLLLSKQDSYFGGLKSPQIFNGTSEISTQRYMVTYDRQRSTSADAIWHLIFVELYDENRQATPETTQRVIQNVQI